MEAASARRAGRGCEDGFDVHERVRRWEVQTAPNPWLSVGFHVDHTDPSITLHLPFLVVYAGRCKQPGFKRVGDVEPQGGEA